MKTYLIAGLSTAALTIASPALAQGQYFSYDGQTAYGSYQECETARTTRTLGGATVGGLLGAGLGTLAGGSDGRNAAVGGVLGAGAGALAGRRSVNCQAIQVTNSGRYGGTYQSAQPRYTYAPSQTASVYSQPRTVYTQPTRTYSSSGYNQPVYRTSQPTRTYTTTRSYSSGGFGGQVYQQPSYSYSQPTYGHSSYSHRQQPVTRYSGRTYTTSQPTYTSRSYGTSAYSQPFYANQQSGYATQNSAWTFDGGSQFASYQACEQARRNRTIAAGGFGALAGAGLGTLAGGRDERNAVVGGVVGATLGALAGRRSVQCQQIGVRY